MATSGASAAAPIFSLLRSILRLHRGRLPPPMRAMGDTYVVSEFRRHLRGKTTEEQWRTFTAEWQRYAAMLGGSADQQAAMAPSGGGTPGTTAGHAPGQRPSVASVTAAIATGSADMTEHLLEHLNPEQRRQLIKLQQEATALGSELLGKAGGTSGSGGQQGPPEG